MTEKKANLFPYPEQRALEDAAYVHGAWPTRIVGVLLPVWSVTVRATILDAEDYDLIDRYLERGLAAGDLATTEELARFFALDEVHVDRALRFLAAIGHVCRSNNSWTLSDLGRRSVREGKRYVITRQDRRTMYFDGVGSHPLPRAYYESSRITFLPENKFSVAGNGGGGPQFFGLTTALFRREALTELAALSNREQFNLPAGIDEPRSLGETLVRLPLYLVRTVGPAGRTRWLAYSQASDEADEHMTRVVQQAPLVVGALESDEIEALRSGEDERRALEWLRKRGMERHRPVQLDNGAWRAVLPASAFLGQEQIPLTRIGSFIVQGNSLCHVWCTDETVRCHTLVKRMDSYIESHTRLERADIEWRLSVLARQLDLGTIDIPELRKIAEKAGYSSLAGRLRQLES